MADISKIMATDGTTYDIKDAAARSGLESLRGAATLLIGGAALTAGTDLNDVTAIGTYASANGTITKSLLNCPVPDFAFRMTVESMTYIDTTWLAQTAASSRLGVVYRRSKPGPSAAWTEWVMDPEGWRFPYFTLAANSSITIDVTNLTFGVMFVVGLYSDQHGAYMFGCGNTGTNISKAITASTTVNVTFSQNTITLENTRTTSCRVGFMLFAGRVSEAETAAEAASVSGMQLMSAGLAESASVTEAADDDARA